jgi:hypothetical protein
MLYSGTNTKLESVIKNLDRPSAKSTPKFNLPLATEKRSNSPGFNTDRGIIRVNLKNVSK